jgi:tetratricopeptide (TPR) repeat protein
MKLLQCTEMWCLHYLKKYGEAITRFDQAIEIEPNHHYSWFYGGLDHHKLGMYNEALKDYNKATEINVESSILV